MLSFTKEAVSGLTPTASLLSSTISAQTANSSASPHRGGPLSPTFGAAGAYGRPSRAESATASWCGVTSQRPVFTVAQVLTAIIAESHPLPTNSNSSDRNFGGATDPASLAAAAAIVEEGRYDLRVAEDDGSSVDPDFPPLDTR